MNCVRLAGSCDEPTDLEHCETEELSVPDVTHLILKINDYI